MSTRHTLETARDALEKLLAVVDELCAHVPGYGDGPADTSPEGCDRVDYAKEAADAALTAIRKEIDGSEDDKCQDCQNTAKHCTADGVWLCDMCYAELVCDLQEEASKPTPAPSTGSQTEAK